ncbi:MAG: amidohydrolase family protein, partial [Victivallaceae bacterium]|nr:amidohydrolase family protein [Victivallaceae bacterium]
LFRSGMPLEKAIRRMTSLPARIFRLGNRGLIKEGFTADLVLFDPENFKDVATFAAPHRIAEGVRKVWRKGKVIFEKR